MQYNNKEQKKDVQMLKRSSANANSKTTGHDTPCPTFGRAPPTFKNLSCSANSTRTKGEPGPALACGVLVA